MSEAGNRCLVVGDAIEDIYINHVSFRPSPECLTAPVLIEVNRKSVHGGAWNVVDNINAMGGIATLFRYHTKPVKKTRLLLNEKQICRIDERPPDAFDSVTNQGLINLVRETLDRDKFDVVVISDYNLGVHHMVPGVIKLANERKIPVLVDPKQVNWQVYAGATLIKPNVQEYMDAEIIETIPYVFVTRGSKDALIYIGKIDGKVGASGICKTIQTNAVDPCGCGDSTMAAIATWWGRVEIEECFGRAMKAGSVAVSRQGTAVVSRKDILNVD